MKNVNTQLTAFRELYGLTQNELAKEIDVTESEISQVESGTIQPSYELIFKLSESYPSLNLNWLFKGSRYRLFDFEESDYAIPHSTMANLVRFLNRTVVLNAYQKPLEAFLNVDYSSREQPTPLNEFAFNVWKYKSKVYFILAGNELLPCISDRVLNCLWLIPRPLLLWALRHVPTEIQESILELSDFFSKKENVLPSILVSGISPHTINLTKILNDNLSDIGLLRILMIENRVVDKVIDNARTNPEDTFIYKKIEYRVFDVTAFL